MDLEQIGLGIAFSATIVMAFLPIVVGSILSLSEKQVIINYFFHTCVLKKNLYSSSIFPTLQKTIGLYLW